jgi:hypothetical protein
VSASFPDLVSASRDAFHPAVRFLVHFANSMTRGRAASAIRRKESIILAIVSPKIPRASLLVFQILSIRSMLSALVRTSAILFATSPRTLPVSAKRGFKRGRSFFTSLSIASSSLGNSSSPIAA